MKANELLNKLAENEIDGATDTFMSLIQDKVADSLEVAKVEIASTIMSDMVEEDTINEGEGMDAQRRWVRQVAAVGKANPEGTKRSVHRGELKAAARKYFQSREPHGVEFTDRAATFVRDARKAVKMKRDYPSNKFEETVNEVLTKADPASKWVKDFVKSDNPKFEGKSKKERIKMALGAYYAKQRNEEVELSEAPTRKHFQQVADLIKEIPDEAKRKELAQHHAGIFKAQNPRFDHKRFYAAAGVNEEALDEVVQGGAVTNAQLNRNVLTNLRRATQTLGLKGVNPQMAAAAHRDFGKLVSKNPKAPGYMLLRKLSANKASQVQNLSQAGVPLGQSLEANPTDFNQALQRIKRFK